MNLIKKTSINLTKVEATVIERNNSKYFDITIPKELRAGKNEIKIKLLRTDIFVKGSNLLLDFYSEAIQDFNYYISDIANADSSRSLIVSVNEYSVNGPCHLYIMADFKTGGSYLCIIDLNINNEVENVQDIKFKGVPEVTYEEKVRPTQITSNVSRLTTVLSSNNTINLKSTIVPRQLVENKLSIEKPDLQSSITVSSVSTPGSSSIQSIPKYTSPAIIHSDDFKFSGSMVNGTIEVNGLPGGKYVANILRVVNTGSVEVWPPYQEVVTGQLYNSFNRHTNFTCSFENIVELSSSNYDQSYAVFNLYNLETSIGVVDSVDVSYKILNQVGTDFQPIGSYKVFDNNLLVDPNTIEFDPQYGIVEKQIGKFKTNLDYFTYWESGSFIVKVYDDNILPNGLLIATTNGYFYPKDAYKVYGSLGTEFRLTFEYDNFYKDQLDIYITGSSVTSLKIQDTVNKTPSDGYGTYIGSVNERSGFATFDFKLNENGYIRPLFRLRNEVWSIANIELKPKKTLGFNPNQAKVIAPLTLQSGSQLSFKLQYSNPVGKKIDSVANTISGVFFTGGSGITGGSTPVKVPDGTVSGSSQLTSSFDTRYERKGTGIISSSLQFNNVSSPFTGSFYGDGSGLYNLSVSGTALPLGLVSGSDQLTSSYDVRYERKGTGLFSSSNQVSYTGLSSIPLGIVSGSNQLTGSFARLVGDNNFYGNQYISASGSTVFSVNGSVGQLFSITDSLSGSLFSVNDISGIPIIEVFSDDIVKIGKYTQEAIKVSASFAEVTGSFKGDASGLYNLPTSSLPAGVITGSDQLTSSYDSRYERRGNNIVSSSAQVKSFLPNGSVTGSDQLTSSYDVRYERKGTGLFSSSNQVSYTGLLNVPANIVSSSNQITYTGLTGTPLGIVSGSTQLTSSFDTRYEIRGNGIVSSSAQIKNLLPVGSVTGSEQLTSSYDVRYERKGTGLFSSSNQVSYTGLLNVPLGIISGSTQLTSSYDTRYEIRGSNIVSSSAQIKDLLPSNSVTGSEQLTSSFDARYERKGTGLFSSSNQVSYTGLLNIPANIVSSSAQIAYSGLTGIPLGIVSGSTQLTSSLDTRYEIRGNNIVSSSAQIKAFLPAASVSGSDQLTSSYDTRYERKGTGLFSSSNQVSYTGLLNVPANIVSSSNQVAFNGLTGIPLGLVSSSVQLTSSFDTRYEIRGSNIVSSSAQIKSLLPVGSVTGSEQLTSSYDVRYERKGTGLFSSSNQVSYTGLLNVPANIVSSSNQITYSGLSGTPLGIVSGSAQLTSSYDSRYEVRGSNIVSSSAQIKSLLPTDVISSSQQFNNTLIPFTGSFTGSFVGDGSGLINVPGGGSINTSSFATTGSNTFNGNQTINGLVSIYKSGSIVFDVQGSSGPLFTITDTLSGSLFNVKNISGIPIFEVFSDNVVKIGKYGQEAIVVSASHATVSGSFYGDGSGLYNIPTGSTVLPAGLVSGSNQLTSSYDTRYEIRGNNIVSSSAQVKSFLPNGSVTGSDQLTSSFDTRYEIRGNNIVSSSAQVKSFLPNGSVTGSDQLTSSYDSRYERKGTNIFSSSNQVSYAGLTGIPLGIVSGSAQLTSSYDTRYEVRGNNIISSSAQVKSFLPNGSVTGSDQLTSSYDSRYERRGTNIYSSSNQVDYNQILNKPIIANPRTDRLITSDGTVSGSRVNDGIQFTSSSKWTKFIFRNDVIQEQGYSSSFWTSEWKFVSQSVHLVSPSSRNYSVYIPLAINNDTNTPITSSTFHSSYAIEVENHIYGLTGSLGSPINTYNWASVTQFRALSNPLDFTVKPRLSGYVAQSSSQYVGLGGYGTTFTGKADLNSWYSVTGVDYAGDGLVQVNYTLGPTSSGAWTIYVATTAKVIKHEIRI